MTGRTTCDLTSRTHSRTGAVPTLGFALIEVDIDAGARAFVALTISVTFFADRRTGHFSTALSRLIVRGAERTVGVKSPLHSLTVPE